MGVFEYLIRQSIKPTGGIGRFMLKIMNNAHKSLFYFGLSNINIAENCNFLDLGFGGGNLLKIVSGKYKDVRLFGIDFSEDSLRIASGKNKRDIQNGKITLLKADIEKIPFPDNYFDIITAFQTHYYWKEIPLKIKEIYRVLKTNGQFVITAEKFKINYHMEAYKTEEDMKELFRIIGFKDIKYTETNNYMCIRGIKA